MFNWRSNLAKAMHRLSMCHVSEQVAGQIGQGGTLALLQGDMGVDRLAHHAADQVAQAIGQGVQVRMRTRLSREPLSGKVVSYVPGRPRCHQRPTKPRAPMPIDTNAAGSGTEPGEGADEL